MSTSTKFVRMLVVASMAGCPCLLQPTLASAAPPPFTPGEQQISMHFPSGTWAIYAAGQGQILAQTFTPSSNQALGYLLLPVGCTDALIGVTIRDGMGGPILYQSNHVVPDRVTGEYQLLQVYDPAKTQGTRLRKGHEYAFELAAIPVSGSPGGTCGIVKGPASNGYGNGQAYYEDVPVNGPGFIPIDATGGDLPFSTLVR